MFGSFPACLRNGVPSSNQFFCPRHANAEHNSSSSSVRHGAGNVGADGTAEPHVNRVHFSTESLRFEHGRGDAKSFTHHFSPLRGEMGCKTVQLNRVNCNAGNSRIHWRSLVILVLRGCGVVATHQLPKGSCRTTFRNSRII